TIHKRTLPYTTLFRSKSAHGFTPQYQLIYHAEYVVRPALIDGTNIRQSHFKVFFEILRIQTDNRIVSLSNPYINSLINCRRQHKTLIIVRMLTDDINPSRRSYDV